MIFNVVVFVGNAVIVIEVTVPALGSVAAKIVAGTGTLTVPPGLG